jgi:nitroreductase
MNVSEAIRMKRAVRQFKDQPLSDDEVAMILQAGRRAQSSKNTQPWQFIVLRDRSTLKSLSECGTYAGHLAGAALGIAILTPDPAERFSIMLDAGQAAAYMQLAAWEMKIGSCLATIYDLDAARQLLGYPAKYHLYIAISFGYPVDDAYLTTPPQKGGRRPMDDIVHWERW